MGGTIASHAQSRGPPSRYAPEGVRLTRGIRGAFGRGEGWCRLRDGVTAQRTTGSRGGGAWRRRFLRGGLAFQLTSCSNIRAFARRSFVGILDLQPRAAKALHHLTL